MKQDRSCGSLLPPLGWLCADRGGAGGAGLCPGTARHGPRRDCRRDGVERALSRPAARCSRAEREAIPLPVPVPTGAAPRRDGRGWTEMSPADRARLLAIWRRLGNASPGPWRISVNGGILAADETRLAQVLSNRSPDDASWLANHAFFAHVHADVGWLLVLVDDLRGLLADQREERGDEDPVCSAGVPAPAGPGQSR
jgi:hypothetical protein